MDHLARSAANGLVVAPPMDRDAVSRVDAQMEQFAAGPAVRFVPVWRSRNLFAGVNNSQAALLDHDQFQQTGIAPDRLVLLGSQQGLRYFAVPLADDEQPPSLFEDWGKFGDLRMQSAHLGDFDAALLAYARSMVYWHTQHRYCGVCGHLTEIGRAGHLRLCPQCGTNHFPRTDPAVIVLAHDGEHCLLGRKAEWPEGRYSTIAGFVEPGETTEQAVLREVKEETGIELSSVTYHSSQPWPFPSSIMLGFHARAASRVITCLDEELEDARWFSHNDIEQAMDRRGPLKLPPRVSIARRLIEDWCHRDT